jgi:hypothetical protein
LTPSVPASRVDGLTSDAGSLAWHDLDDAFDG